MQTQAETLAQVIRAIGDDAFPVATAGALCRFAGFDLASIVVHRGAGESGLMYSNLDVAGGAEGLDRYVRVTHRLNPMLKRVVGAGVFRAREFRWDGQIGEELREYVSEAPEEELGFRTLGWPAGLEEVGVYFAACGGTVELSLYRQRIVRTMRRMPGLRLAELQAMCWPIAAAFERHASLQRRVVEEDGLSRREREITELLLIGCGTEAVALRLGISPHTVKDYRKQIFRKLGICSLAELFALYRER